MHSTKAAGPDLEAEIAITLTPWEAEHLEEFRKPGQRGNWTGWYRRHWPANVVRPGLRLYGFDVRPDRRNLCALLEIDRGEAFTYSSKREFAAHVRRITKWRNVEDDRHWQRIAVGRRGRPCTGIAMTFRLVKRVNIDLGPVRFPQLGWRPLVTPLNESDIADLYEEGRRTLQKHWVIERDPKLRADSKAYWRRKLGGRLRCIVCHFDFYAKYGVHGEDWIELHHETPLGAGHGLRKRRVDELKPLCSNCHRMVHRRSSRMLELDELRSLIGAGRKPRRDSEMQRRQ